MDQLRQLYSQVVATRSYLCILAWQLFTLVFVYLNLWAFLGEDALPPHGTYFHLTLIFIAAQLCAKIFELCRLPGLLGMLLAGELQGL
jgi:hypothetical protein